MSKQSIVTTKKYLCKIPVIGIYHRQNLIRFSVASAVSNPFAPSMFSGASPVRICKKKS